MSILRIHSLDTAPPESRASVEAARARFGFVPNLIGELSGAPAAVKAYLRSRSS